MTDAGISFPRQNARTVGFSLGVPYAFAIGPDGSRVAFLRARSGTDRSTGLWVRDTVTGEERLVADPEELLSGSEERLPPEERARRERTRQAAAGVVSFAADEALRIAAFALSGRLFVADLADLDGTPVRSWWCRGRCSTRVRIRREPTSRTCRTGRCAWSPPMAPMTGRWRCRRPRM